MISALPGLLAETLAREVSAVAGAAGIFAQPCRAVVGDAAFAGPDAARAAVFVSLGALDPDAAIGARSEGEVITLPFTAEVRVALAGPDALTLDAATREPPGSAVDGADLMLSAVAGLFATARDAGADAPLSRAVLHAGGRRITAQWRHGQTTAITPGTVAGRQVWRLEALFEGRQVLSPLPVEGGHILRVDVDGRLGGTPLAATLQGNSAHLPLAVFVGLGPAHAERLASFGLLRLGDLMRIPRADIAGRAAEIARGDADLSAALTVLHAVAMMRLDAVRGGLNAAHLFERHAALTLDRVWDGATLTLPGDMRGDQRLRVRFMAEQLLRLIRPEARAQVTLGQLATLNPEGL